MSLPSVCRRPVVGFCGSRSLGREWFPLVSSVVSSVLAAGRGVAVGCARGADSFVRSSAGPRCAVARVRGQSRGAFAARSRRLVSAVARRRFWAGSAFVGFVSSPCPSGVLPGPRWSSGRPASGSWSSLALAAGLGLPVFVFWCAPGPPSLPASWGGSWVSAAPSGVWSSAWRWVPPVQSQLELDLTTDNLELSYPVRIVRVDDHGMTHTSRDFQPEEFQLAMTALAAHRHDPSTRSAHMEALCPVHGRTRATSGYCTKCLDHLD